MLKEPTITDARYFKKLELASFRYLAEVGGIDYLGVRMHTDRESQAKYAAAAVALQATGECTKVWKGETGWLDIPAPDVMTGLAAAVQTHVAKLYAREHELAALVDAAETAEDVGIIMWTLSEEEETTDAGD